MKKSAAPRRHLATSPFNVPVTAPVEQFVVGDRVTHDQYGLGWVLSVEDETAVSIDFGSCQERIPSPYSKLTKL